MYKLSLAHIYPNLLNFYGDNGNVITLKKRCEWRGIELKITEINENDDVTDDFDMYFLGGALPVFQNIAVKKLLPYKNIFHVAADNNAVILAISESYQILGEYYQYKNQEKVEGLGLLDVYSVEQDVKLVGNVTATCDFIEPKEIVGFENHSMQTYIKEPTLPLSQVIEGKNKIEGARKNNVFGTYLHGPMLPKNPHFADYLIELALEKKYGKKINLETLNDEIELNTYKKLVGKKY